MTPTPEARFPAPPVAVAVVSWNTRDLLRTCLHSLQADADAGLAEVWVVDNASDDGSAAVVRREFPWAHLEETGHNLGFGRAVNVVSRLSAAPWIAAANADLDVQPGALQALLSAAEDHPDAGVLAPRLLLPDGRTQHSVHRFLGLRIALAVNLGLAEKLPAVGRRICMERHWDADLAREVDWAHGAFLLVRREAFDAIGGFDERQWMYAEDLDLCWRLRQAGWRTRYVPAARVGHRVSAATTQAFGDDRTVRAQRSAYSWSLRRRGWLRTRALAGVNVSGAAARWALARQPDRRAVARGYVRMHLTGLEQRARLEGHR